FHKVFHSLAFALVRGLRIHYRRGSRTESEDCDAEDLSECADHVARPRLPPVRGRGSRPHRRSPPRGGLAHRGPADGAG
ncbi:hypothetical protein DN508_39220, partial [Burkholderia multivorans]